MRGTSTNLTCFDCRECIDAQGTRHGFCKNQDSPIGGLEWSLEDFDRFSAHINPRFARYCGAFKQRYRFVVRSMRVTIYISTVDQLREVFGQLKGGKAE